MLAHAATREGIVAVNNMFGKKDRIRYQAIPSVIYTHPEVASVGRTEEELKAQGIEYKKSVVPMAVAGRFLVENEGGTGMVKVLAGARYGEILGVHAIGDARASSSSRRQPWSKRRCAWRTRARSCSRTHGFGSAAGSDSRSSLGATGENAQVDHHRTGKSHLRAARSICPISR